jgi:hypothetical protein
MTHLLYDNTLHFVAEDVKGIAPDSEEREQEACSTGLSGVS